MGKPLDLSSLPISFRASETKPLSMSPRSATIQQKQQLIFPSAAASANHPSIPLSSSQSSPAKKKDDRRFSKWLSIRVPAGLSVQQSSTQFNCLNWFQQLKHAYTVNAADNRRFFLEGEAYFLLNLSCYAIQLAYTFTHSTEAYIRIGLECWMIIVNFVCALVNAMHPSQSNPHHNHETSPVVSGVVIPQWLSHTVILMNLVAAVEIEVQKISMHDNTPFDPIFQIQSDTPIISMYSIAFLYCLITLSRSVKGIDQVFLVITQICGICYFLVRYYMNGSAAEWRWEIPFSMLIVIVMLFKKEFWQMLTSSVKERLIENSMKEGIVKNIKAFYNNVFEVMPQGIAIIDSEKYLVFNNAAIKQFMDCETQDLVKCISNIVLKKKNVSATMAEDHPQPQQNNNNNNHNESSDGPQIQSQLYKKSMTAPDQLFHLSQKGSLVDMETSHNNNNNNQHTGQTIIGNLKKGSSRGSLKQMRIQKSNAILQSTGMDSTACDNLEQIIDELLNFGHKFKRQKNFLKRVHTVISESTQQKPKAYDEEEQNVVISNDSVSVQFKRNMKHLLLKIIKKELEAITQYRLKLLASVSHELKTPLNFSINFLETLSGEVSPETHNEFVVPALASNRYLFNVFNDILDYSSIEAKKFSYSYSLFSLYDTLREALDIMSFQGKFKELDLSFQFHKDIPTPIISDPNRIRQIVLNLLSNAIKFTFTGKIILSATYHSEGLIQISVQDTGIGISKDNQSIIFNLCGRREFLQKNSKLKLNTQGVGLGLSISSRLAQGLSKQSPPIHVTSVVNEGSTFSFYVQIQPVTVLHTDQHASPAEFRHPSLSFTSLNSPLNPSHHPFPQLHPTSSFEYPSQQNTMRLPTPSKFQVKFNSSSLNPAIKKFEMSNSLLDSCELTRFSHVFSDDHIQLPQEPFHLRFRNNAPTIGGNPGSISPTKRDAKTIMNTSNSFTRPAAQTMSFQPEDVKHYQQQQSQLHQHQPHHQMNVSTLSESMPLQMKDSQVLESMGPRCSCVQILYIDDNEFNLLILQNMIKRLGYSCDVAISGDIGLKKIQSRYATCKICQSYQLIFCDIDMPIKDGYETTKDILSYYKEIGLSAQKIPPIIACSALNIPDFHSLCKQAGMALFLPKPIDKNTLAQILSNIPSL